MGDIFSDKNSTQLTATNTSTTVTNNNSAVTAGEGAVSARGNVSIVNSDAGSIAKLLEATTTITTKTLDTIQKVIENENAASYAGRQIDAATVGSSIGAARSLAEGAATGGASIIGEKLSKILLYGLLGVGLLLLVPMFTSKRT